MGRRRIPGETSCMCQMSMGFTTLLYSAEEYHHMYGTHNASWQCQHECPRKCASDWHHGRFFGCYDQQHLIQMERDFGHRPGYTLLSVRPPITRFEAGSHDAQEPL